VQKYSAEPWFDEITGNGLACSQFTAHLPIRIEEFKRASGLLTHEDQAPLMWAIIYMRIDPELTHNFSGEVWL